MSQLIEVYFKARVGGGNIGDIKSYEEDSLLLRALILGGHVDILNPPDWVFVDKEKENFNGPSYNKTDTSIRTGKSSRNSNSPGNKSTETVGGSEKISSEGHGESSELSKRSQNNGEGKASTKTNLERPSNSSNS